MGRDMTGSYDERMTERLLRKREVAELLGVSTRTVSRLAERGEIDVVRIGRGARYRADDVRSLIERSREERRP
jgi:excisionase family DNA binding protein